MKKAPELHNFPAIPGLLADAPEGIRTLVEGPKTRAMRVSSP